MRFVVVAVVPRAGADSADRRDCGLRVLINDRRRCGIQERESRYKLDRAPRRERVTMKTFIPLMAALLLVSQKPAQRTTTPMQELGLDAQ